MPTPVGPVPPDPDDPDLWTEWYDDRAGWDGDGDGFDGDGWDGDGPGRRGSDRAGIGPSRFGWPVRLIAAIALVAIVLLLVF